MCQTAHNCEMFQRCKKSAIAAQSYPTLSKPMDSSLPGSSVHGILQARILEWVAISLSRGSSQPRERIWISHIAGRFFTISATGEVTEKKSTRKADPKIVVLNLIEDLICLCQAADDSLKISSNLPVDSKGDHVP